MRRSLTDSLVFKRHLLGTYSTTQTPSNGIDVSDLHKAEVKVNIGTITNVANSPQPSWSIALQHSDTVNSGFEAVAATDVVVQKDGSALASNGVIGVVDAAAEDDAIIRVGYVGGKKYVRTVLTAANTPGNTPFCVEIVGEPRLKPGADS